MGGHPERGRASGCVNTPVFYGDEIDLQRCYIIYWKVEIQTTE